MRNKEHIASGGIDVCCVYVETTLFEVQVGINIDNGIIANGYALVVGILDSKHSCCSEVVGCIVGCEIAYIATNLYAQHFGQTEVEIQIGIDVEHG